MEESNKLQWRLLFSGMSRIRLLVPKLKCAACCAFYLIAPCFLERQGRDNLFSKELARLARPVYFAGDTLLECMLWVLALFGFSEWKRIPKNGIKGIIHKFACNLIEKHYNDTIGKNFEHKR